MAVAFNLSFLSLPYIWWSALALLLSTFTLFAMSFFSRSSWDPNGKRCFVTGGSSGLGLAFATLLIKKGAHVAIVARDEKKLADALAILEGARVNKEQIITSHAFSLDSEDASLRALEEAAKPHGGKVAEGIFTCAGTARPGYFLEETAQTMKDGMTNAFWIQAFPAMAASKLMAKQGVKGRICFVSSLLGKAGLIGYASYAPGKHALVGLAESLRFELAMYDIKVHIFLPATILSPGYENENKTKPAITLKIEETDEGVTPAVCAESMFQGIQKGYSQFGGDLNTELFRVSTRGSAPNNNLLVDNVLQAIAWIGIPIWRRLTEGQIRKYIPTHLAEMKAKGLVN